MTYSREIRVQVESDVVGSIVIVNSHRNVLTLPPVVCQTTNVELE